VKAYLTFSSSTPVPFTAPECPSAKPDLTSFDPTSFFAPPVDAYCKCTSCSQLSISKIASNVPLGCPVDAYCKCTSCSQLSISKIASNVPLGCPLGCHVPLGCHRFFSLSFKTSSLLPFPPFFTFFFSSNVRSENCFCPCYFSI